MRQSPQPTMFDPIRLGMAQASDTLFGSPLRNLALSVMYMLVVMTLGVVGYTMAGWSFGEALYVVMITVYSVGYGGTMPINTALLRGITICLIVLGCTGMIFLTGALVQLITLNQIKQVLLRCQFSSNILKLRGFL